MAGVQLIQEQDAAAAFKEGVAKNLRVIGDANGWYYTFQVRDPSTGSVQTFRTKTSRGHAKRWSQPSTLFRHLQDVFGVARGSWHIKQAES